MPASPLHGEPPAWGWQQEHGAQTHPTAGGAARSLHTRSQQQVSLFTASSAASLYHGKKSTLLLCVMRSDASGPL